MENKVERERARARKREREREGDAYLVASGREFQMAGFKWLKKRLLRSDSEQLKEDKEAEHVKIQMRRA